VRGLHPYNASRQGAEVEPAPVELRSGLGRRQRKARGSRRRRGLPWIQPP